ncbi:phage holin family protein [Yokenella regensburgei]|uniref:phage holin family protein n=1 Tax=Yokenella regensburgei TaxID=158877 RepID=UPI003EDB629B
MTWDSMMLHANAVVCFLIMFRLMFFNKAGKSRRFGVSVFAYLIILAAGYTAFRIVRGDYLWVDPGELMLNASVCVAVLLAGGNLANFMRKN